MTPDSPDVPTAERERSSPPGGTDLRLRRRIRTKEQIQAEALALFAAQGFDRTSVEDVAQAAAISPRTFYRYFACKEDLVLWDAYDELPAEQVWVAHPGDDPLIVIVGRMRELTEALYVRDRDAFLLRTQLSYQVPEIRARFVNRLWDVVQPLYAQLTRSLGRPGDDLRVAVPLAAAFAAMLVALEQWARHGGRDDLPQVIDEALGALGVSVTPGAGEGR